MSETVPFTIEQFYKFVNEGKVMAAKCKKCGTILLPPRPMCIKCHSNELEWTELAKRGKLLTYTIIHVAPPQFQHLIPYAVGIVKLQNGMKIPGMIRGVNFENLKIGMELEIEVEKAEKSDTWPNWPRYYFKPV